MQDFNITTPETVEELLLEIERNQSKNFRFGAGFTDLIVELKKNPPQKSNSEWHSEQQNARNGEKLLVINLSRIKAPDFTKIEKTEKSISIGALVTAAELEKSSEIRNLFPVLHKAADTLASKQIRQVATVGGNICTASPAGDISTALVALEAVCEILSTKNEIREVPLINFFTGVRKIALNKNEVLRSVTIPIDETNNKIYSDFIKIGTRRSMECSIVSLAYHFILNEEEKIQHAGIAIGSSAPTIKFTQAACDFVRGKRLNEFAESDTKTFAEKVIEYASPISDIRGSDWYRKQVLFNISRSVLESVT